MWKTLEEYTELLLNTLSLPPCLAAVPALALRIQAERVLKALHAVAPLQQDCQVWGMQPRE